METCCSCTGRRASSLHRRRRRRHCRLLTKMREAVCRLHAEVLGKPCRSLEASRPCRRRRLRPSRVVTRSSQNEGTSSVESAFKAARRRVSRFKLVYAPGRENRCFNAILKANTLRQAGRSHHMQTRVAKGWKRSQTQLLVAMDKEPISLLGFSGFFHRSRCTCPTAGSLSTGRHASWLMHSLWNPVFFCGVLLAVCVWCIPAAWVLSPVQLPAVFQRSWTLTALAS